MQTVAETGETALVEEYEASEAVQLTLNEDEVESDMVQTAEVTAGIESLTAGYVVDDMPVSYVRPHGFDKDDVSGWVNKSSPGDFVTSPEIVTIDDVAWLHYSGTYLSAAHALNVIDENSPMIADGQISFEWRTDPEIVSSGGGYNFSFGAIVRYVDEANYLNILYTDSNFVLEWRNEGVGAWTSNFPTPYRLQPGSVHTVVAQFIGDSVTIYLDGELIGTITNSGIPQGAGQMGFRNHNVSTARTRNVYVRDIAYTNLDTAVTDPAFGSYYIRNHSETQEQAEGGFVAQKVVDPTQTLWDIRRGNAIGAAFTPPIDPENGNITLTPPGAGHQNFVLFDGPEFADGAFEVLWTPTATLPAGGVNHSMGFVLRYVDETNFIQAQTNTVGQWHLESATQWTGSVQGGVIFEAGQEYRIRFEFEDNQILVSIDGGEPFSLPTATWMSTAPGRVGFRRHNNWSPSIVVRDIAITPADGAHARQTIRYGIGRTVDYDYADITVDTAEQTMEITEGVVYDPGATAAIQQGLAFGFTPTDENMEITALLRYTDARNFVRLTLANDDSDVAATMSGVRNGRAIEPIAFGAGGTPFVASETSDIKVTLVNDEMWILQNGEEIARGRLTGDSAPTMVAGTYGFEGPAVLSNIAYLIYDLPVIGDGIIPTPIPFDIKSDDMVVTINQNFPSVIQYEMVGSGYTMDAQPTGANVVSIGLMRENLNDPNRPAVDFIPRKVEFEPGGADNYATYTMYIANENGTGADDGSDDIFEIVIEYSVQGTTLRIDTLNIVELGVDPAHRDLVFPEYDEERNMLGGGPRLKSIAFPNNATASVVPDTDNSAQIAAYWPLSGPGSGGFPGSVPYGQHNWNFQHDIILNLNTNQNMTRRLLPFPSGNPNRGQPGGVSNNYVPPESPAAAPTRISLMDRSGDVGIVFLSNGDISATMINNRSNERYRFRYDMLVDGGEVQRGHIEDGRHFWRFEPSNAFTGGPGGLHTGGRINAFNNQRGAINAGFDINWALLQQHLPLTKVVLTEDVNGDDVADWQDGAVAYRRALPPAVAEDGSVGYERDLTHVPINSEFNRNSIMWCAMNIQSGAGMPFLRTLDISHNLYNLFDGFGQRIYHKGYQAEGHDDSHPDYGNNFGQRLGGVEDFNALIEGAALINSVVGIHLNGVGVNADSFYSDARTNTGIDEYTWIDPTRGILPEHDVLSGHVYARLAELNEAAPGLAFIYLDVYSESDWVGRHVMQTYEHFGWQILTEFGGPMRSFVSAMHWGIDTGYPSQSHNGTTSQIIRFIFNDGQDSFEPERLLRGAIMPRIGAWRGNNYNESVRLFHGVNIPTKFLQHFELMHWDHVGRRAEFTHGVVSERVMVNGAARTHITMDGILIADLPYAITYNANGQGMLAGDDAITGLGAGGWTGFISNARIFAPWTLDVDMDGGLWDENTVFERAFAYQDRGGTSTWTVPENWTGSVSLYELTDNGRVLKDTVAIDADGQITITLEAQIGYVVYPDSVTPIVGNRDEYPDWGPTGEATMIRDGNFDSRSWDFWNVSSTGASTSHVEMTNNPANMHNRTAADSGDLNHLFVQGNSGDARVYQDVVVTPGRGYNASVWARVGAHNNASARRVTLRIEDLDGNVLGESFIMRNMQHMMLTEHPYTNHWINSINVKFWVPDDITTVRYVIEVESTEDPLASVYLNWATMREFFHQTTADGQSYEAILNNPNIVFFEDFENTNEYWGDFFLTGRNSSRAHLALRVPAGLEWFVPTAGDAGAERFGLTAWNVPQEATHVTPQGTFDNVPGGLQPFHYVINGHNTFKQHEEGFVGRMLRTLPQTLRLEEDTTYRLSFYYRAYNLATAGDQIQPYFSVQVRARQGGAPHVFILNEQLANTPKAFSRHQPAFFIQENEPEARHVTFEFDTGSFSSMDDPMDGDIYLAFEKHHSGLVVLMLDDVKIEIVTEDEPVTSIAVSGENNATTITTEGGTLQMLAEVLPITATNRAVAWSVSPTGLATISTDGLLTAVANGIVTVRATARDGSAVYGELAITITGQPVDPPVEPPVDPPRRFTISFNANGGTGAMQAVTVTEGANFTVPANVFTRVGYEFAGWNTLANGRGTAFAVGAIIRNVTSNMTLFAQWNEVDEDDPPREWLPPQSTNPFVDVPNAPHWQNDPVSWAVRNGIATGIANTTPPEFRPNRPLTRETFATFLHRVAGAPEAGPTHFADNASISSWANGAVRWAVEAGVVLGFADNTFRPQTVITREQIAVMLFRFAEHVEKDLEFETVIFDAFPDSGRVSSWALEAVQWATYNGLITGIARPDGPRLEPQGNATRAQAVAIIYRFVMEFEVPPPEVE